MATNRKTEEPIGWTTIREGRKLLDAGVDTSTADMCYIIDDETKKFCMTPIALPYDSFTAKEFYVPCWSLGAIMRILPDGNPNEFNPEKLGEVSAIRMVVGMMYKRIAKKR